MGGKYDARLPLGGAKDHTSSVWFTLMSTYHMQPDVCVGETSATGYDMLT